MAKRGRPKPAKKAKTTKAKKVKIAPKAIPKKASAATKTAAAIDIVKSVMPSAKIGAISKSTAVSRGVFMKKKRTAKQRLKQAYERRAIYQIRTNQLGQARKTLRKKMTVV